MQEVRGQGVALWSLNQPLLEKTLRKWEQQTGRRIDVVQGNSPDLALDSSGFRSPAPTAPRKGSELDDLDLDFGGGPSTVSDEPKEDWIPDLEDLKF